MMMNADLLKIYARNYMTSVMDHLMIAGVFIFAKIYFYGWPTTPEAFFITTGAYVLLGLLALSMILNERRLYREVLSDRFDTDKKDARHLTMEIGINKIFYMVPWLLFLFMPLESRILFDHLLGYFFIFVAIAAYGSGSAVFFPLFAWNVLLQVLFALIVTYLNRDVQETVYIGGAIAVFAGYTLISGYKITRTAADLVESRRIIAGNARRAKAAEKAKTDFLAVMSHEIRTPMAGVLGMVDYLQETKLTDEQRECLETITQCSRTLLNTLNDVLDVAREESGNLVINNVNFELHGVLNNAAESMRHLAEKKNIALVVDIDRQVPTQMHGDPNRLQQAVFNLLNNAIKFTAQGRVSMKASLSGGSLLLEITDTGIGIDRDKIKYLFRKFSQAEKTTAQEYGGSGLGLSIVRKIIELMGGKIGVRSEKGKGSTFWFTIPYVPPVAQEKRAAKTAADIAPINILLVEDNQINQMVTTRLLQKKGHQVTLATTGDHALALLNERAFDLVLMDSMLPGKSGIETAMELKSRHVAIPVIAFTANNNPAHIKKCIDAGMADCILKPFSSDQLYAALAKYAGKPIVSIDAFVPVKDSHFLAAVPNDKLRRMEEEFGLDYMQHVILTTLAEMQGLQSSLITAQRTEDKDALSRAAHDLKSVSGYIGLEETSRLAGEVEAICLSRDQAGLDGAIDRLLKAMARETKRLKNDAA